MLAELLVNRPKPINLILFILFPNIQTFIRERYRPSKIVLEPRDYVAEVV